MYYSFTVLCFGFSLSPYFFYKCLRPVVAYLRSLDIRLVLYVDDFLVCANRASITDHTDTVLHTLQDLGLKVNFEKSVLKPSQNIDYLGYNIDTSSEYPHISAKQERVQKIKRLIKQLIYKKILFCTFTGQMRWPLCVYSLGCGNREVVPQKYLQLNCQTTILE